MEKCESFTGRFFELGGKERSELNVIYEVVELACGRLYYRIESSKAGMLQSRDPALMVRAMFLAFQKTRVFLVAGARKDLSPTS